MPVNDAVALLQGRVRKRAGQQWPGHLARLVIEELTYDEVLLEGMKTNSHLWDDQLREAQECIKYEVDFWEGVRRLSKHDSAGFLAAMKHVGCLTWDEFDKSQDFFIDRFRSPELHLARFESGVSD